MARERTSHIRPSYDENYLKSIIRSVTYCAVISRTTAYWSLSVKMDRAVMGTSDKNNLRSIFEKGYGFGFTLFACNRSTIISSVSRVDCFITIMQQLFYLNAESDLGMSQNGHPMMRQL